MIFRRMMTAATKLSDNITQRQLNTCSKLVFNEFGDPLKVLKLQNDTISPVQENEVCTIHRRLSSSFS